MLNSALRHNHRKRLPQHSATTALGYLLGQTCTPVENRDTSTQPPNPAQHTEDLQCSCSPFTGNFWAIRPIFPTLPQWSDTWIATDSTLMKKWKQPFVKDFQCKSRIYTAKKFLNAWQDQINASMSSIIMLKKVCACAYRSNFLTSPIFKNVTWTPTAAPLLIFLQNVQ